MHRQTTVRTAPLTIEDLQLDIAALEGIIFDVHLYCKEDYLLRQMTSVQRRRYRRAVNSVSVGLEVMGI